MHGGGSSLDHQKQLKTKTAPKAQRCYSTLYNKIEDPHITLKVASQTCNEERGVMGPFFSLQVHCSSSDELSPLRCLNPVYDKCIRWSLVRINIGVSLMAREKGHFAKINIVSLIGMPLVEIYFSSLGFVIK